MSGVLRAALAADPMVEYIGNYSHNEFYNIVAFHTDARPGDYAVVCYYSGTIAGGAAKAWSYTTAANSKWVVAHRRLEAADLSGSPTIGSNSPLISMVWRGPGAMSLKSAGYSTTNFVSPVVPGYVKTPGALALICIMYSDIDGGLQGACVPPFGSTVSTGPANYRLYAAPALASAYANNGFLSPVPNTNTGERSASVFELRY